MHRSAKPGCRALLWLGLLYSAGCAGPGTLYQRLESGDPNVRVAAIKEAGELKDARSVPLLVDRLESEDGDERVVTTIKVRRLTWERLRRLAEARSHLQGGRPSASGVIEDLVAEASRPKRREARRD